MKPTPTKLAPRRKLAAFRLPPSSLVRLRQIAERNRVSQSRILESLIHDAIRLNAETIAAGSRCTELRSVRDKTRRGSAQHTAAADALFDAQANHAELERQRDSAWAVANRRR